MARFRILCDVDGVLADLVGALAAEVPGLREADVTRYELAECLAPDMSGRAHRAMATPGFCSSLDWYPGARAFLACLRDVGDVFAVTTPYQDSATWPYERTRWLASELPKERILFATDKSIIGGTVLVEDSAENAAAWLEEHRHGTAILIDRPWNQHARPHPRQYRAMGRGRYARAYELVKIARVEARRAHQRY